MADVSEGISKGSANATEAPTSGVTEAALIARTSNPGLSPDESAFATLISQYYAVHGVIMPIGVALTSYHFTEEEFVELIKSPMVQAALKERGVVIKPSDLQSVDMLSTLTNSEAVGTDAIIEPEICSECGSPLGHPAGSTSTDWREQALTPLQLIVANTMLDLVDARSQKKKLQDLSVSTATYQMWLKDPVFARYMHENSRSMLQESEHEAYLALMDKVRMGDSKAISMYFEMQGIFVPERGQNAGTSSIQDFKMLMIRVLEIIQEEVPLEFQFSVGERIRSLIGVTDTANSLVNSVVTEHEIVTPKIKAARVLSPRLQELMDKGVGND